VRLDDHFLIYSTDRALGPVDVVVYPWDVSIALTEPQDSALNHIGAEILSIARVGNRARVRVGNVTAELTAASADRLELAPGLPVVATFKATATRLLPHA
jgi:molybdate transport system ATP-binding protein